MHASVCKCMQVYANACKCINAYIRNRACVCVYSRILYIYIYYFIIWNKFVIIKYIPRINIYLYTILRYANACKCMQMHIIKIFLVKKFDICFFYDTIRIVQGKEKSQKYGRKCIQDSFLEQLLTSCLHKFRPPLFGEKRWI